jgi:hypothetical protein
MVDVLEEMTVDVAVDCTYAPVGIHVENRDTRLCARVRATNDVMRRIQSPETMSVPKRIQRVIS